MTNIIDGLKLAEKINKETAETVFGLNGERPNLAIIIVGDRPDSTLYVKLKEAKAKEVGVDTHLYRLDSSISQKELLEVIDFLNADDLIDAILVQLPLPDHLDANEVVARIKPSKDVDCFHPENIKCLKEVCGSDEIIPPVFAAVSEVLSSVNYDLKDKNIVVLANSEIFGKNLADFLSCRGANASAISDCSPESNFVEKTKNADVIISAIGQAEFLKKEMAKEGVFIIDIGTNKKDNKICGDACFEELKGVADFITPVPGGIGPLTVALLLSNALKAYKKRKSV